MYLEMKERRMKRKIMKMFMKMRKPNYLKKRKKKKTKLKTFQYFLDYTPGSLDYWAFVIKRINKLLTYSQIWFTFGHYHLLIKKNMTVAKILESRLWTFTFLPTYFHIQVLFLIFETTTKFSYSWLFSKYVIRHFCTVNITGDNNNIMSFRFQFP